MPTCGQVAPKSPPGARGELDRLFDRLVADLRATAERLAAGWVS